MILRPLQKHTQLMIYGGTHAMKLHGRENASCLKTHMLVIQLEPAPSDRHGEFMLKSFAVRSMADCGLDSATCVALAELTDQAARNGRYSLTMYVQSGIAVYLVPITVPWCNPLENVVRFGHPEDGWEEFMERGINNTLQQEDEVRTKRMQGLI
ncbi:hypothetical protein DFH07DRAFT_778138 [Mycena maculata]|uniref:Uncharacterized protein n=1 Tax=Mycena maculata TaxID=230809 RepID=A0AAD7N1H0_9AGAR|nr:hypothetical protein DFH07DRAFT_778138 [Mycena maculata]